MVQVAMLLSMLGNEHEAYWGCRYERELAEVRAAIASNSPDPLESLFVWFGKMAMLMACQTIASDELALAPESVVLDLGCGNGFTCEVLHKLGFKHVIGSDYSLQAICLAQVRPCPQQRALHIRSLTLLAQQPGSARALQVKGKCGGAGLMGHKIRGG
jgi:SAM-dependent methyltransferase